MSVGRLQAVAADHPRVRESRFHLGTFDPAKIARIQYHPDAVVLDVEDPAAGVDELLRRRRRHDDPVALREVGDRVDVGRPRDPEPVVAVHHFGDTYRGPVLEGEQDGGRSTGPGRGRRVRPGSARTPADVEGRGREHGAARAR